MSRVRVTVLSAMLSVSLASPGVAIASPETEPPIEGPRRPRTDPPIEPVEPADPVDPQPVEPEPGEPDPDGSTSSEVPAPELDPELIPSEPEPGIEFAVPPPGSEDVEPIPEEPTSMFPDPGMAPSDGVNMLVLGGTTTLLTIAGFTTALVVGLENQVELSWLLPSTIVPAVGLLAFSGGGLYLGISRARAHRRWEIGYRVIGQPQGGGLMIGGSFTLLGALGLIPAGALQLKYSTELGAALIAVGSAAAVATPIMFVVGARNSRRYQATGGWKRKPIPPLPPGATTGRLELRPMLVPLGRYGLGIGAVGRF